MPRNKIIDVGSSRFTVRGLAFEELVNLGSANAEGRESKDVVTEVLSQCLVDPKLKRDQITALDYKTLAALVSEVLNIAWSNMEEMELVSTPPDRAPPERHDGITPLPFPEWLIRKIPQLQPETHEDQGLAGRDTLRFQPRGTRHRLQEENLV
jgi:hypothetical protein